jgi:uncharacterized protein (DUF924 family)
MKINSMLASFECVLDFWFSVSSPSVWYRQDDRFDDLIRDRFLFTYQAAADDLLNAWRALPSSMLALIIVLDQFPRNMFRNDSRSFATDHKALGLVREGLTKRFDRELESAQLDFFLMPLMHSEKLDDHLLLVSLGRGDEKYAREHRETIKRFGRFPKRNAVLGRRNTADEEAYLAEHQRS